MPETARRERFEQTVLPHLDAAYSLARWLTRNDQDAQDVTQEACDRADAVLVLTEWKEFVDLDPDLLADRVRSRVVVDGRNCLDLPRWQQAGWRVHCLGRRVA